VKDDSQGSKINTTLPYSQENTFCPENIYAAGTLTMSNTSFNRMQRIADQIQRELAVLLTTKAHDPRFLTVSITAVNVSPDMANATVLVSQLDEQHIKETLAALNKAAGFLRYELAHTLNLRITPRLRFIYDESISKGDHIDRLIDKAIKEDDAKGESKSEQTPE
jgi:ribosome-binding factor A